MHQDLINRLSEVARLLGEDKSNDWSEEIETIEEGISELVITTHERDSARSSIRDLRTWGVA